MTDQPLIIHRLKAETEFRKGQEYNLGPPDEVIQPDDPRYAELKAHYEASLAHHKAGA